MTQSAATPDARTPIYCPACGVLTNWRYANGAETTRGHLCSAEAARLRSALRDTTGAIIVTTDGFEAVDSLAGLDWRNYESAVRTPDGGGR